MLVVMSWLCLCISIQFTGPGVQSARLETTEAQQIALESQDDQLLAPTSSELVQIIQSDLALIRSKYPEAAEITHQAKWNPGVILAEISDDQISQINGSEYGPIIDVQRFTIISTAVLTFEQLFNPVALGNKLESSYGISSHPDGIIGRSEIISYDIGNSTYSFEKGSGDCPSGCIVKSRLDFFVSRTEPPNVTLAFSGYDGAKLDF